MDFDPAEVGANVTVTVCAAAPALTVNVVGLTVNIVVSAVPTRAMEKTISAALPVFPTVNVFWDEDPTAVLSIASDVTDRLMPGAGCAVPFPVRETVVGLPDALCVIVSVPVFDPAAVGRKVTVTAWLFPALTVKEVCETVNSGASVPDALMFVTCRSALPVFVIVSVCVPEAFTCTSPKARLFADRLMAGAVPVPLTETDAGLPVALCVIVSAADLAPAAVGVNVTVIVWLCPAATVAEVGLIVNAASLDEIALTVIEAVAWLFVSVNVCWPDCPTRTFPNESVVGLTVRGGAPVIPFPLSVTVWGLPLALCAMDSEADLAPVDVGAKVTVTVCVVAPGLTVKLVGVTVNCGASVPDALMEEMVRAVLPVFPTVKVTCLVCPVCTSPKLSVVAERLMTG